MRRALRSETMRWDSLFDDLEGQLESEWSAEEIERRAEDERLRIGRLSVRDRLLALGPGPTGEGAAPVQVRLRLRAGRDVNVVPRSFGRDWMAGDLVRAHGRASACIVPIAAVCGVLLSPTSVPLSLEGEGDSGAAPRVSERIGLAFALRDVCRRRAYVTISGLVGSVSGTIDRVARDHIDVAIHAPGTPRRTREVSHVEIVATAAIDLVEL